MTKNILIVDDHPFIINGLEKIIEGFKEFVLIAKATNGLEAIAILEQQSIDMVFTDIEMPEMGGLELIEHINLHYPAIHIVVLTMHAHHWMLKKILRMNVGAVLSKSAGELDFKAAVHAIERGEHYFDENVQSAIENNKPNTKSGMGISIVSFTERELEILSYIYQGLTSKDISEKMHKSVHTIESHRKNLFIKSGVKNVAGLLKFAFEKGLLEP